FFQAEDGIRDFHVTGVQTCALPISVSMPSGRRIRDPVSTGVAASRPNWVSLSSRNSLMGTPSTANIIQIMKQTVNARVLMLSTRDRKSAGRGTREVSVVDGAMERVW